MNNKILKKIKAIVSLAFAKQWLTKGNVNKNSRVQNPFL